MSRIFEALRRSERTNASNTPAPPGGAENPLQNAIGSIRCQPDNLDTMPPLACRPRPEDHILALDQDCGRGLEEFRVLGHRLGLIRQQHAFTKLLITSAVPQDGKTLVAVNLASVLARNSSRVLLVDADIRHPGVHSALGIEALPGLADILEHGSNTAATVRHVAPLGFYSLLSGSTSANPADLLQTPRLQEFVTEAAATFDWIVFDSPPVGLFADAQRLAALTDAVLFVVREGSTPRKAVEEAIAALRGSFIAGIVLNASTALERNSYRYYRYYDGSGKSSTNGRKAATTSSANPTSEKVSRNG